MNPEAIIVFVVLIAINALFSKNKTQKQQQRRNQQSQNKQRPAQQGPDRQRSEQERSTKDSGEARGYGLNQRHEGSSENKDTVRPQRQRQRPRSLLEEVLEQYNITEEQEPSKSKSTSSEEIQENAIETKKEEDHYTDYSNRNLPKKSRKKKELKGYTKRRKNGVETGEGIEDVIGKDSVDKSEIGTEGFDKLLKFDQRSLVQGIVMAEILDKPKATRKKRAI